MGDLSGWTSSRRGAAQERPWRAAVSDKMCRWRWQRLFSPVQPFPLPRRALACVPTIFCCRKDEVRLF